MPDRITQLNALFQQEISLYYKESLPELFFTVTRVAISPDLHEARVWVSFLQHRASSLDQMTTHLADLGRYLGKRLRLKRIPHITLLLDTGMEYAEEILERLQDIDST